MEKARHLLNGRAPTRAPGLSPPPSMNVLLEKADTYLHAHTRDSHTPWSPKTSGPAPFITISREAGSGGASLARLLVRRLNHDAPDAGTWSVFDDNLTPQMLKRHGLPTRFARFLPEDRVSEIHASIGELVGLHPSLYDLVQKTNATMRELASRGRVVLVGRGANFATADQPGGRHIRLIAPSEHRARYLAQLYNISEAEARVYNGKCDAARRRYVRAYFDADVASPTAYDLVINTGRISADDAANLISAQVRTAALS
jgi:cytidylate kinase